MNSTLTALINDVYTLTKRPDLEADTKLAVKRATLKLHQSDFYRKDLVESGVQFDTDDKFQTLAYKELFPRLREIYYIRKSDVNGTPGDFLTKITPGVALDSYGYNKENVYYEAGVVTQIRSLTNLQYILLGFYQYPDLGDDTFSSWIADEHFYAIVIEAAVTIFKTIGFDEQATTYSKLAAEELANVRASGI